MSKCKKLVLYYDPTALDSSSYTMKTIFVNTDGKPFDSINKQKQYVLRDIAGKIYGEAQLHENTILSDAPFFEKPSLKMFSDLFRLKLGDEVDEQYQNISMNFPIKRPAIKVLKLTNTVGKHSFTCLKWEWPEANNPSQLRKLTFYKK